MTQFFDEVVSKEIDGIAVFLLVDENLGHSTPFFPDHFDISQCEGGWIVRAVPKSGAPFHSRVAYKTMHLASEWIRNITRTHSILEHEIAFRRRDMS